MIKEIKSKQNVIIKNAVKLKESKYRRSSQTFLIEGKKMINEALAHNLLIKVFTTQQLNLPYNIEQFIVSLDIIKKISSSTNPEGVLGIAKYPTFKEESYKRCLYLDNLQDPGNVGSIIRSAVSFGYECIFLSKDCVDVYNEKVISASKGAIFYIPIITKKYEEINVKYQTIASSLGDNVIPINEVKISKPFVLILGNEAHGIRKNILDNCDIKTKIPMVNFDSLNVSVAAGVLMYLLKNN